MRSKLTLGCSQRKFTLLRRADIDWLSTRPFGTNLTSLCYRSFYELRHSQEVSPLEGAVPPPVTFQVDYLDFSQGASKVSS